MALMRFVHFDAIAYLCGKTFCIMSQQLHPDTLCVQAGWTPGKGEPRVVPIYQSTTFKYETSDQICLLYTSDAADEL